jgi:hypothetical protein
MKVSGGMVVVGVSFDLPGLLASAKYPETWCVVLGKTEREAS